MFLNSGCLWWMWLSTTIVFVCIIQITSLYNPPYDFTRWSSRHINRNRAAQSLKGYGTFDTGISCSEDYTAVMIIPTGIGASVGGYAGDGLPAARLLASVVDTLITHPNVMNGAMLYWPIDNILYVEGSSLDAFASGELALRPLRKRGHRIGLLLDKGIEPELRIRHMHVADAVRATLGINVCHAVVTPRNIGVKLSISRQSGASWGSLQDTAALVEGAQELISKGCTAIAVVARFPEDDEYASQSNVESNAVDAEPSDKQHLRSECNSPGRVSNSDVNSGETAIVVDSSNRDCIGKGTLTREWFDSYRNGSGVDAIAGAEALITHIIGKRLRVPCAHAPAFAPTAAEEGVAPKACAEELGYTFLPCLLANLHRAPELIPIAPEASPARRSLFEGEGSVAEESNGCSEGSMRGRLPNGSIIAADVDAVVVPYDALGGAAVLALAQQRSSTRDSSISRAPPLIIAVEDNKTSMRVTKAALDIHNSPPSLRAKLTVGGSKSATDERNQGVKSHAGTAKAFDGLDNVIIARSYAEAAGILAAHKNGILLEAITPKVSPLRLL